MKFLPVLFAALLSSPQDATIVEKEKAPKEVKRTDFLGTKGYTPREKAKEYFKKLEKDERVTGTFIDDYKITGKKDKYVSWFGVVREIKSDKKKKEHTLLLEHKYFDGLTDTHIMAVSFFGGGDFKAKVSADTLDLKTLVLVRVYGEIVEEKDTVPVMKVRYMRVFPWKTFTFISCYGMDRRNTKWKKLNKIDEEDIYDAWPNDAYYEERLGKRK